MIARAAEYNVTIFRKEGRFSLKPFFQQENISIFFNFFLYYAGLLPLDEVINEFLTLCIEYDSTWANAKYCVQMMLRDLQESPRGRKFLECQTLEDIWLVSFC